MGNDYYVIAFGTVNPNCPTKKKSSTLHNALSHNRRATHQALGATTNIDLSRSHLNYTIKGNADIALILRWWKAQREATVHQTGKPIRTNAPHAIEVIMSLPARWAGEQAAFFNDCLVYAEGEFGTNNVISADIHLDETYRHCHILFLPIVERQDGRHWISPLGNANHIHALRTRFYELVGAKHGLKPAPQITRSVKAAIYHAVTSDMQVNKNPAMKAQNWNVIKAQIASDPIPHAHALGIDIDVYLTVKPAKVQQNSNPVDMLTKLMTSSRPEKKPLYKKPIRGFDSEPIINAPFIEAIQANPYPSVRGFVSHAMQDSFKSMLLITVRHWGLASPAANSTQTPPPLVGGAAPCVVSNIQDTWYDRDNEHDPSSWNDITGDYEPSLTTVKGKQKLAATLLVSNLLTPMQQARNSKRFKSVA